MSMRQMRNWVNVFVDYFSVIRNLAHKAKTAFFSLLEKKSKQTKKNKTNQKYFALVTYKTIFLTGI